MKKLATAIPKKLQNATLIKMFLQTTLRQKTRNRTGYSSLFLKAQIAKTCCLKYRIFKYLGYSLMTLLFTNTTVFAETNAEYLQQKLNNIRTMQASFKQIVSAKNTDNSNSSGKMALAKPSHFRWQTLKPMPQLFIADGKRLWIYDEELEQVSVRKQGKNLSGAAAIFLSDDNQHLGDDFEISMLKKGKVDYFNLHAKAERSTFSRVELVFSGEMIKQIDLYDELGQHTKVAFTNVELNPELSASLFKFTVPKGTDVVRQ